MTKQQILYITERFAVSDDDNLNSVLAWKLKDMNAKQIFQNYRGKGICY